MKTIQSILIVLLFVNLTFADDNTFNILVPGYGNPNDSDLWPQFINTAQQDRNFGMAIILNPNSGPGITRDGNYLNDQEQGPLADLQATGTTVYGYVFTRIQSDPEILRPIQDVKDDIDGYLVNADLYAGFVQGIFIDEVSSKLDNVSYYQALRVHVHMRLPGAPVIGNPGQPALDPAKNTQFTEADFVATFDTIISFENFGDVYLNGFESAPHLDNLPNEKIAHLVHTQAVWQPQFLELAVGRGAGFIYVTDDICKDPNCIGDNPYDELATYWEEFVSDVSDFNSRAGHFATGKLNGDNVVDLLDVAPFVQLISSGEYQIQADTNCDGDVNLLDVAQFVQILTGL